MLLLNSEKTADLNDLAKSALICQHLNLDFSAGEDVDGNVVAVSTAGVIAGLQISFEIMGLPWPVITTTDVAEFREINGI